MQYFIFPLLLFFLFGCGGGSSGSDTGQILPAINRPPVIEIDDAFSVFEGDEFSAIITTTDQDGDDVELTLSGVHEDLFSIESGALILVNPLDYETLIESGEATLNLIISATDGKQVTTKAITLTIKDAIEGRVVDGPVSGAVVFLDKNNNFQLDEGEVSIQTDANGYFALKDSLVEGGNLISLGGVDIITNNNLASSVYLYRLNENITFANVTPLSSVIALSTSELTDIILQGSNDQTLLTQDSWEQAKTGTVSAQEFQVFNAKILSVINAAKALTGRGDVEVIQEFLDVLSQTENQDLNKGLLEVDFITNVLIDITSGLTGDNNELSRLLIDSTAEMLFEINIYFKSNQSEITTSELADIFSLIQEDFPNAITDILAGQIDYNQFTSELEQLASNTSPDADGDGVMNADDTFPLDAGESIDTDVDGIGNNADTDDDGDGVLDADDAFPLDPEKYYLPIIFNIDSDLLTIPENEIFVATIGVNYGIIDEQSYAISGSDKALFNIDSKGNLTLKEALNYEALSSKSFSIIVTYESVYGIASKPLTISISNVNEGTFNDCTFNNCVFN